MKLKKIFAAVTASVMLALTACTESGGNAEGTSRTTTSATSLTTTTAPAATKQTTTTSQASNIDVAFMTYTFKIKDAQNYEYEVTLKLSPWILDSKTDVLDAAWAQVGKGKSKPTKSNMGMQKYSNNRYMTNIRDAYGRNRIFDATMTNMYFSVGTVSVKNVTKGWDITAQNPGSCDVILDWVPQKTNSIVITNEQFISKSYYSSKTDTYVAQLRVRPKMTKNSWGPSTVVLAHAENISPKYPDGQYKQQVLNGSLKAVDTVINIPIYG